MDAKIITTSNFPVDKKYYIYDFIDEITCIVFGYVYDSLGTNNAINVLQRAIKDFSEFGITPLNSFALIMLLNSLLLIEVIKKHTK